MDLLDLVRVGSLEQVKELVANQDITTKRLDYKMLNTALECGRKDLVGFLLDINCKVNKNMKSTTITNSPLHNAVKLGDLGVIKRLLRRKASILALNSEKNSPLHLAFINNNKILVDLFLAVIKETSNFTNLKNGEGLTHFHIACTSKNGQIVQSFLNAGAYIEDAVNNDSPMWAGFSAMHFAASFQSLESIKVLLKAGASHHIRTCRGDTPSDLAYNNIMESLIMINLLDDNKKFNELKGNLSNFQVACLNNSENVVKSFIDHGVELSPENNQFSYFSFLASPLHCAVASRCNKKVELLLQHGAKVDCIDSCGMTPLHLALNIGERICKEENHQIRVEKDDTITKLLYAAVEDKMNPHMDRYGLSYFHIAITRNDIFTVTKYLDEELVDLNKAISSSAYRYSNYSPLHLAVWYQHPEIVELLVERGANVNVSDNKMHGTPLHMAFEAGDIDFIELFLNNGAEVDLILNYKRKTMLHLCVIHIYFEVESRRGDQLNENPDAILLYAEQLIKLGVEVNAKDADGNTALHLIHPESSKCAECFKLLLDLGADINIENNRGQLPFNIKELNSKRCKSEEYKIFYYHVQKLKLLGMKVHPLNEECCKMILENNLKMDSKEKQMIDEITMLKSVKLGDAVSLYDFIKMDSKRAAYFGRCEILRKLAEDNDLKKIYFFYGYIIRMQYEKAFSDDKMSYFEDIEESRRKRRRCE